MENHNSSSSPQNFCGCQCSSPCDCWKKSAPQMENKDETIVYSHKMESSAPSLDQFIKEKRKLFNERQGYIEIAVFLTQAYQLGKEEERKRIMGAVQKLPDTYEGDESAVFRTTKGEVLDIINPQ